MAIEKPNDINFIMNQITLFPQQQQNPQQAEQSNLNQNRPQNIKVQKSVPARRWHECKIIGKNISIRSYSASCGFNGKFYIYGGYQILNGSLSDFYSICLDEKQTKFDWIELEQKGDHPGPRSKHGLVSTQSRIYLVGGLHNDTHSSNDIFEFNPETSLWTSLKPQNHNLLPKMDSFGCLALKQGSEEKIIIVGGYDQEKAKPTNAVYEYNITNNKISILFQHSDKEAEDIPKPRIGTAIATDANLIYVFGGKDEQQRFNDIWTFSLSSFCYKQLPSQGQIPYERNGHTMHFFDNCLFIFGGIKDITWELDDLMIYDLKRQEWTTIEQDSPRKVDKKNNLSETVNVDKESHKKNNRKKNWYETAGNITATNKVSSPYSPGRKNFSTTYREDEKATSPGKMIDQQRKKIFHQKKTQMLKNFEVNDKDKKKYVSLETSSQAMKNSLDVIGNPDQKKNEDKLSEFGKESHSKFLDPLQNNCNLVYGKKPCARDGQCSALIDNELIIFGGDRHQMSFNDIYKLDLKLAK